MTLGLLAIGVLAYLFVTENFPILPETAVHPLGEVLRRVPTVVGFGNPLMGDDAVGLRAMELLRPQLPQAVRRLETSRLAFDLLPEIERASRLLVLDCVDAGRPVGTLVRVDAWTLLGPAASHLSPHETSLADLLALAALRGRAPDEVVVLGAQPGTLRIGLGLSTEVEAALPRLVEQALELLAGWAERAPASVVKRPAAGARTSANTLRRRRSRRSRWPRGRGPNDPRHGGPTRPPSTQVPTERRDEG